MPAQTINIKTIASVFSDAEKDLIKNTNKLLQHKFFKLGEGYDEDKQANSLKVYGILRKNYCPLNDFMYTVLREGPQQLNCVALAGSEVKTLENITPPDTLYQLWLNKGNVGTYNDFLDVLFNSQVDVWEGNEW
jgi:hypothetical protein